MTPPTEIALPLRPLAPSDDDCCHSDCAPHCVFDDYERQLERWELACQEQLRLQGLAANPSQDETGSP